MFVVKKILTPFLIPPGLFVLILLISGLWFFAKKSYKAGILNILIGIVLWFISISPMTDFMMRPLEAGFTIPHNPPGDVIIVLGGGINDLVPDLSGTGFPGTDSLGRLVTAARLQKNIMKPVIISSGQVFPNKSAEAPIARRILVDLGVPSYKIFMEAKSRDTMENARYSKQICTQEGFKTPIVVTSAFHMKRSVLSFQKIDLPVIPYPANFRTGKYRQYTWNDYLPDMANLDTFSKALHEYIGLVFYQWRY
ncbi:MAG: YdcF family protein [Deltaproteobacteria bacterium]|nr:YdcF family protein [Deltaproteobacteria bacterium]